MKKLKRILVFTISAICCALLYTGCTFDAPVSDSGTSGNNLKWTLDYETGALTITGSGAMTDYDFSHPKAPWLYAWKSVRPISNIILSEGITTIGDCAFYSCYKLSSITIPNSLIRIGISSFEGCSSLVSVILPKNLTSMDDLAFANCDALNEVTCLATTPPNIGKDCFRKKDGCAWTLYVPTGSVNLYKSNEEWKQYFEDILPISE